MVDYWVAILNTFYSLACLIISFLFACGLYGLSSLQLFNLAGQKKRQFFHSYHIYSAGYFLIAIVLFCLFSNILMLIPPVIESVPGLSQVHSLAAHRLIMIFISG